MLEGDWLEHERAGCDVDRESIGDDSHVMVRLQKPLLFSPQMWQPEGFLALQDVMAPLCGLFSIILFVFVWVKFLILLYELYTLLLFYMLILWFSFF